VQRGDFRPPRHVKADIPPALEAVCLKAMAQKMEDRYGTALQLAEDIEHWLADEPVSAYPEPVSVRLRRWARQHKPQVSGAAAALLVGVVALAAGVFWYQQDQAERYAQQVRHEAQQVRHEAQAQQELAQALDLHRTLHRKLAEQEGVRRLLNDPERWAVQLQQVQLHLDKARALATQADVGPGTELSQQLDSLKEQLRQDETDRRLAVRLEKIRTDRSVIVEGKFNNVQAAREYPQVFAAAGLNVAVGQQVPALVRVRIARSAIKEQLVAALDDWALVAWAINDLPLCRRLLAVAQVVDRDPWRKKVRALAPRQNAVAVQALADKLLAAPAALAKQSPQVLDLMGNLLHSTGGDAARWLRQAQAQHPMDFWLSYHLAVELHKTRPAEAVGYCRAALAVRPESAAAWNNLGMALHAQKDLPGATAAFHKALKFDPQLVPAWFNLGVTLDAQKDLPGAIAAYQRALKIEPQNASAWNGLGIALSTQKDLPGAVTAYQRALEIDPQNAPAWYNLGLALYDQKDLPGAVAAYQSALKIEPQFAPAWHNLGLALYEQKDLPGAITAYDKALKLDPRNARAWYSLGVTLDAQKDLPGAVTAFQRAVKIDSQYAAAWYKLGQALYTQKDLPGATAAYDKGLKLDPQNAVVWYNLGLALYEQKDRSGAVAAYQSALKIKPQYAQAWNNLGVALDELKDLPGAIAAYDKALKLDPQLAPAWANLGLALYELKDLPGAMAACHKALKFDPQYAYAWHHLSLVLHEQGEFAQAHKAILRVLQLRPEAPSLRALAQKRLKVYQQALRLEQRALDLAQGKAPPGSPAELLQLAQFCRRFHRPSTAVRLYAAAFTAQPGLTEDLAQEHHYHAACAAAAAAAGQGLDAKPLSDKDRTELRRQALDWLRADLKLLTKTVADHQAPSTAEKQPPVSPLEKLAGQSQKPGAADLRLICDRLQRWQQGPDLAGVREDKGLAKLPPQEQKDWRQFWDEVRALEQQARASVRKK
jgi:tetratricopeptide (TPR) repeat protein